MAHFDTLWNYSKPAETESKFREMLEAFSSGNNLSEYLQLKTQIARTFSLRRMFDDAHKMLDEVENQLPEENDLAHARYHLERGRTFNSSGNKEQAFYQFTKAKHCASSLSEDFFTIDAIHMLAIIALPQQAVLLNEEAILYAENSKQERAKNWLGSLYNNLAWNYFDKGEFEKALSIFLRALKWREEKKTAPEIFLAKWCVARTLRALNKLEEAMTIQLALFEEALSTGEEDGYVYEELGELFLLKQDKGKTVFHFEKAWQLLGKDAYLQQNESARLERIKRLAEK